MEDKSQPMVADDHRFEMALDGLALSQLLSAHQVLLMYLGNDPSKEGDPMVDGVFHNLQLLLHLTEGMDLDPDSIIGQVAPMVRAFVEQVGDVVEELGPEMVSVGGNTAEFEIPTGLHSGVPGSPKEVAPMKDENRKALRTSEEEAA